MNHVTFETAVRLKEAGFPQPDPELGQTWYGGLTGGAFVVCRRTDMGEILMAAPLSRVDWSHRFDAQPILSDGPPIFAPTATDIMRALPGISLRWHSFHRVWQTRYRRNENRQAHENPAEACALVWLHLL